MKTITMVAIIVICLNYNLRAQVTIGCGEEPVSGALLQLKDKVGAGAGANASKGLGLPLVALVSNSSLNPCVEDNVVFEDPSAKLDHAGLLVYNVGAEVISSPEEQLCRGLHVWNGNKWRPLTPYPETSNELDIVQCQPGPDYTLDCTEKQVYGMYSHGITLNNTHYIKIKITAPASSIGEKYIIKASSSERSDISFKAEGTIESTEQYVTLVGTGVISTIKDTYFQIVTNSSIKSSCSALVRGTAPACE